MLAYGAGFGGLSFVFELLLLFCAASAASSGVRKLQGLQQLESELVSTPPLVSELKRKEEVTAARRRF
jgi:hypothetical protein